MKNKIIRGSVNFTPPPPRHLLSSFLLLVIITALSLVIASCSNPSGGDGGGGTTYYIVTFHLNGGDKLTPAQQRVAENGTATDPGPLGGLFVGNAPGSMDFTYNGWYTDDSTYADDWDFDNDPVTGNLDLYAAWTGMALDSAVDISEYSGVNVLDQALAYIAGETTNPTNYTIVLDGGDYTLPGIPIGMEAVAYPDSLIGNITNPNAVITLVGKTAADISLSPGSGGSLFVVTGGELVLDNNITLTGSASNTASLVTVGGDNVFLTMNTGAEITGNTSNFIFFGGGVTVTYGGTFTMNGGKISGNFATYGGGVLVSFGSHFTMSGTAEISGNTTSGDTAQGQDVSGGGVMIIFSDFTMSGGKISGNTALNGGQGGGVAIVGGGYYIGSVLRSGDASFDMSGGEISNNTANRRGGGVYVNNDDDIGDTTTASFAMSGGTISGNTALSYGGGGVWIEDDASFTKTGASVIYGDMDHTHTPESTENTATNAPGHAVYYHPSGLSDYYRDTDLGSGVGITTGNTGSGWTELP